MGSSLSLAEQALEAAVEADRRIGLHQELPRLHGVPFTVKQNIDVAGTPTDNTRTEGAGECLPPSGLADCGAEEGSRWHRHRAGLLRGLPSLHLKADAFIAAMFIGEGLISSQGFETGTEDFPPLGAALMAAIPAGLVMIAPAVTAIVFGGKRSSTRSVHRVATGLAQCCMSVKRE
jgi:hypothetical protein